MLKSYLIIAFRNFRKGRFYSLINLFGLAIGLASVMLIAAYVSYELSYDKYDRNYERIYQLVMENHESEPIIKTNFIPELVGKTMMEGFAEVEATTILIPFEDTFIHNDKPVSLHALLVSPTFFNVFSMPFIRGNPATAFSNKSGMVLTENAAKKLFPNQEAVGKTISKKHNGRETEYYTVTGIIKNIPENSHFNAEIIIAPDKRTDQTLNFNGYSSKVQYVLMKEHSDVFNLEKKLSGFFQRYNSGPNRSIQFLPLADIHLQSGDMSFEGFNTGNIRYMYIFSSVAFLLLVICCMNYVNLTTAQSLQRIKEIGVRKTLGSRRRQLALQFVGESVLFFCLALLLAFYLAFIFLPVFNSALQINLLVSQLFNVQNILVFISIGVGAGLISGMYPALFLSRMQPAGILKDNRSKMVINFSIRKALIVAQFSISVMLMISTIVVWQQLDLFNNRPLGFNKDHLLILKTINSTQSQHAFKKSLLDNSNVLAVSFVGMELGKNFGNTGSSSNPFDSTQRLDFAYINADYDFIRTMNIKLKEGRTFSENIVTDGLNYDSLNNILREDAVKNKREPDQSLLNRNPIIISESLAKKLKLKSPVNTVLKKGGVQGTVIGVTKDFQLTTLKKESPLLVYTLSDEGWYINTYIRLNNRNIPASINHIEKMWKQYFPDQVFEYSFADQSLQKLYKSENRLASIFSSFALLAIGISALGLFSLVALIVKQRNKEIGVRKVLGASISGIVILLSKDFLRLILLSVVIASPVAWYGLKTWLQDFAYRVDIQWTVFVLAAVLALVTGMLTVSFQTFKAARMNPVNSLKQE